MKQFYALIAAKPVGCYLKRAALGLVLLLSMAGGVRAAAPINDEPANAVPLPLNKTCINIAGTTIDATPSAVPAADGLQQTGGARTDVFYSFVAPCSTVTITVSNLHNAASTANAGFITLYSRNANTYTSLGQQPYSLTLMTLTAGQTYYVRVQTCYNLYSVYTGVGATFNICATVPHALFAPFVKYAGSQRGRVTDLAVSDLNSDTYPDIVTSNHSPPTAGVLLNRGNGSFGTGVSYASAVSQSNDEVVTGDVNNDGSPDIIMAHASDNQVAVFLNSRSGTFTAWATYPVSADKSYPSSVALGDVNNDGSLDIVTANYFSKNVSVLLNRGNGSFLPAVLYGTGTNSFPVKVVVADLNKDGYSDILVGHNYFNYISVLYNGPGGVFAPATSFTTGPSSWPIDLAVADMNADGYPDVVTANGAGNSVGLLLNRQDGTLAAPVRFTTYLNPNSVALGDLSGDGRPDIAVGTAYNTVGVLYNLSSAAFTSTSTYRTDDLSDVNTIPAIALGDVDRDGKLDIVAANYESGTVSILRNLSTCAATVTGATQELKYTEGLELAPNPAHGYTTVLLPAPPTGQRSALTLRDTQGRLMMNESFSGRYYSLPLAGLAPGLYLVQVQNGGSTWTRRLVIE